jgi:hypothetical protein
LDKQKPRRKLAGLAAFASRRLRLAHAQCSRPRFATAALITQGRAPAKKSEVRAGWTRYAVVEGRVVDRVRVVKFLVETNC